VTGPQLPTTNQAEAIDAMIAEAGIVSKGHSVDYATEYVPKYRDAKGQYEGWAYITGLTGGSGDVVDILASEYWSKSGVSYHGFDAKMKGDQSGDPQVDALIEKARVERDTERRRALVFDLQRYLGKSLYGLLPPGVASGFEMVWPCLRNFRVHLRPPPYLYGQWVDEAKPPFKG
jgi:ABC-type transport system substrate-binding protein